MFLYGIMLIGVKFTDARMYGYHVTIDQLLFYYCLPIGFIIAAFSSLFLGTEYSDGTIRNKLIIGHSRLSVYFANLITNIIVAILLCISYLLSIVTVGFMLLGTFTFPIDKGLLMFLGTLLLIIAFCSIFTLISMVCTSKAATAVISILGVLALLITAALIGARLDTPAFQDSFTYSDKTGVQFNEQQPNPKFLTGTKRIVYESVYDILPTGQSLQYTMLKAVHLWQMPLYSMLIVFLTTAIGVRLFKKKDLK